jgi:CBS domain-containing protein
LKVSDIITRSMVTISSDATVLEASKQMVQDNVGLLVVCDASDKTKLVGVVSERDIIRSIVSPRGLPEKVNAITTREVITVNASADVAEAAKAMNKHRIRHVVVVDDHNSPRGVVSLRDLVGERATLRAILQSNEREIFVGGD